MIECEAQSVGKQRDSSLDERMTSGSKRDRDNAITRDTGLDSESLHLTKMCPTFLKGHYFI